MHSALSSVPVVLLCRQDGLLRAPAEHAADDPLARNDPHARQLLPVRGQFGGERTGARRALPAGAPVRRAERLLVRSVRRDAAAHRNARALPGERRQVVSVERAVPLVGTAGAQLFVVARRHRLGAGRLAAAAPPARRRDVRPHDRRRRAVVEQHNSSQRNGQLLRWRQRSRTFLTRYAHPFTE